MAKKPNSKNVFRSKEMIHVDSIKKEFELGSDFDTQCAELATVMHHLAKKSAKEEKLPYSRGEALVLTMIQKVLAQVPENK